MPYLLPSNLPGDDDIESVCVYYPNDPLFKSALLGALNFFTKWVAWERTQDGRAAQASKLWYQAFERTLKSWDVSCGGCPDMCSCEEMREIIKEELENMTIQNCITVNCGCGCGSGADGVDTRPPEDYVPPELPPIDEPVIPEPSNDYLQYKCNAAHYLYYIFRTEVILKLSSFKNNSGLNYKDVSTVLAELDSPIGTVALVIWEVYYNLVEWLTTRVQKAGSAIVVETDKFYDQFVCAVYGADGANDARDRWYSVLDMVALEWSELQYLKLLSQSIDFSEWLVPESGWENVQFPPGYQDRMCDQCGANFDPTPSLPEQLPEEYVWMVASADEVSLADPSGITTEYNEYAAEFTSIRVDAGQDVFVNLDMALLVERYGVEDVIGFVCEVAEAPQDTGEGLQNYALTNGPDFYFDGMDISSQFILSYSAQYDGSRPEFTAWRSANDALGKIYQKSYSQPAGLPTGDFAIRFNTGQGGTIKIRHWVIGIVQ